MSRKNVVPFRPAEMFKRFGIDCKYATPRATESERCAKRI